jgi:hypothetical protein
VEAVAIGTGGCVPVAFQQSLPMTQKAVFLFGMAFCAAFQNGQLFIPGVFLQGMDIAMAVPALYILVDKVNTLPVFLVNFLMAAFTGDGGRRLLAGDMPSHILDAGVTAGAGIVAVGGVRELDLKGVTVMTGFTALSHPGGNLCRLDRITADEKDKDKADEPSGLCHCDPFIPVRPSGYDVLHV